MIDGQVRDLRRLESAQRDLARTETAARRDLEAAEGKIRARRQKERLENARRKSDIEIISARLRELGAERKKLLEEATAGTKAQLDKIAALERAEEVRRRRVRLEDKKRKAAALESDAASLQQELKAKTLLQGVEAKLVHLAEKVTAVRKQGAATAVAAQNSINAAVEQEVKLRRAIKEQERADRSRGAPVNPAFLQWEGEINALKQQRSSLVGQRHSLTQQAESARHGVLIAQPQLAARRDTATSEFLVAEEGRSAALKALSLHLKSRPDATTDAAKELEAVRESIDRKQAQLRQYKSTSLRERRQLQELGFLEPDFKLDADAKRELKIGRRLASISEAKGQRRVKTRLVEQDLEDALRAGQSRTLLTGAEMADAALGDRDRAQRTLKRRVAFRKMKEFNLASELQTLRAKARKLSKDKSLSPEQEEFERRRLELEEASRTARTQATAAKVRRATVESEIGVEATRFESQKIGERERVNARIREIQDQLTEKEGQKPQRLLERDKSAELTALEQSLEQAKAGTKAARAAKSAREDAARIVNETAEAELTEATSRFERLKAKLAGLVARVKDGKSRREIEERRASAGELELQIAKQTEIEQLRQEVKASKAASTREIDEKIEQQLGLKTFVKDADTKARSEQAAAAEKDPASLRAKQDALAAAKANTELARRQVEAKRLEVAEARRHIAEMRDTRALIRQHLAGAVFDMVTKFAFITGYLRSVGRVISDAAKFRFEATGLTAMLDKTRGAGEDVYGRYARSAAYQSEVSPAEAVARMTEFAAAGYGETEIPKGIESLFNVMLASRGEVTAGGAADLGISLHRAFGGAGVDMASLMDTAVSAANRFPMTIGKVRDALGYATEAAVQADQTLEETLIAIGSIMPITKTASKAGTITRNAITSLARPKGQRILQDLGVTPKDAAGNMRPIMDVFLEISKKLEAVAGADDSVLKMKKEELEFALTGQRGGAIFAAIERMPEMASAALRGTIYEQRPGEMPYIFKDAEDALKAMRMGLMDTAGEARRMADQLRKTSHMLGQSFDVSLEKFRISLGTYLLPMRDAMLGMTKNFVDSLTAWLDDSDRSYGQPGGRPAGSSITANLLGGAILAGGTLFAARAVMTLMRTGGILRALTQPKRIEEMTRLMRDGMSVGEAFATTSPQGGVGRWDRFSRRTADFLGSAVGRFGGAARAEQVSARAFSFMTQGIPNFIGKFLSIASVAAPVVGALMMLNSAVRTARLAITDYTDVTRSDHQRRVDRQVAGLKTVYQAAMEGRLSVDANGNIRGIRENEMKSVLGGGTVAATAALNIAQGMPPEKALEIARQRIAKETSFQFGTDPEEQRKALMALSIRMDTENEEFFSSAAQAILVRQRKEALRRGDTGRVAEIETLQAAMTTERLKRDFSMPVLGQEMGGEAYRLIWDLLQTTNAPDLATALSKPSTKATAFKTMMLELMTAEQFKDKRGTLTGMLGEGVVGGWSSVMSSVFGYGEDVILDRFGNVNRSEYNEAGQWKSGMTQTFGQLSVFQQKVSRSADLFSRGSEDFAAAVKVFADALKNPVRGNTGVIQEGSPTPTRVTTGGGVTPAPLVFGSDVVFY